jgi:endoglucanase
MLNKNLCTKLLVPVLLIFMTICLSLAVNAQINNLVFRTNLAGYPSDLPKKALLLSTTFVHIDSVFLVHKSTNKVIPLKVKDDINWEPFKKTYSIDFTDIVKAGTYFLSSKDGTAKSEEFEIGNYPTWHEDIIRFMQTQRCGFNPFTGEYCHQHDGKSFYGQIPDSTDIDARGGWHDAGDQLKYLITASNATARMLLSYQMYPEKFGDRVDEMGLPGKNGLPDIIDEAKWGLDWIFKLHPNSNELYHQVADDRDHKGFKIPHLENVDYGWGVNKSRPVYAATGQPQGLGKFKSKATGIANLAGRSAAAMALGYQVFKKFPAHKAYANKCLQAAKDLYKLGKNNAGYQQGNSFGAPYRYEENTWADDMEWGAAALYKCTKDKMYLEDAREYAKIINSWSWMERDTASHYEMYPFVNIGHYALWEVGNANDKKQAIAHYSKNLEKIKAKADQNSYGVGHLFIWCSNHLAAAVATQALLLNKMTNSKKYDELLQNHSNWLLGLNPWGTSMITEIPENKDCPDDVHMPFWILLKKKVKGSLVDGPLWSTIHDKMIAIRLSEADEYESFQPPHIRYWDDYADYSTNEPTMDGSADLILLMAYFSK